MTNYVHSNIVKLIGFLIANICHDDKEWKEWGLPFIYLLLSAQELSSEESKQVGTEINEMFSTLVDSKINLVCEEGEGFIVLHVGQIWWQEAIAQNELEVEMSNFLNNYIAWTSTSKL